MYSQRLPGVEGLNVSIMVVLFNVGGGCVW